MKISNNRSSKRRIRRARDIGRKPVEDHFEPEAKVEVDMDLEDSGKNKKLMSMPAKESAPDSFNSPPFVEPVVIASGPSTHTVVPNKFTQFVCGGVLRTFHKGIAVRVTDEMYRLLKRGDMLA